jgi:hypothetical protein
MSVWINSIEEDQRQSFYRSIFYAYWQYSHKCKIYFCMCATMGMSDIRKRSFCSIFGARRYGHMLLKLPPYVCATWNPIKLVWEKIKPYAREQNVFGAFNMAELGGLRNPGCYSRQLERWKVFGMWPIVIRWSLPDVWKDCVASIFMVDKSINLWSAVNQSPSDLALHHRTFESPPTWLWEPKIS